MKELDLIFITAQKILNNSSLLESVAKDAYIHQLGFEKFTLERFSDGSCIRLHYWEKPIDSYGEDIHSHCASFYSIVISGEMTSVEYDAIEGKTHRSYLYKGNSGQGCGEIIDSFDSSLRKKSENHLSKGSRYSMNSSTLHQVTKASPGTLTCSYWKPNDRNAIVAIANPKIIKNHSPQTGASKTKLAYLLKKVTDHNGFIR